MATIKDVAKAAGVGTGTVSRALSGKGYVDSEKKKQIIKIAEQLEYDPSALLKRKNNKKVKSGLIGVVLPNSSQPFFGSFLWHVEQALEMHEYRTVIINVGGSSKKISDAIDLVDKHMLDGLIINADVDKSDIERLRLIPAVSFECEMGEGIPLVASDHIKGGELAAKVKAQRMADALASMLRNAGGTMTTVAHSKEEYARYTEGITDVMSYLGVDTSKDFTVNGMKYSKNKDGWYESEANSDAQAAYEQLKANNRTYQFADEKTKKQIAYISDYYLQTVPESVKAAWQETLEETGFNPFQTDVTSTLTQLSVEQDFLTGGDDNIFGETKESCLAAIDKVLERIENPLAAVTEERAAYLQQEKEFYTVLASKIRE